MRCMQVALLYVQENSTDRPSMLEVDTCLKNEVTHVGIPNMPAFLIKKHEDDKGDTSKLRLKFSSINEVTISEMVAR
ncbi:unnamed protein product [Lathyrus sativus]|nr:unnamed protein product [Lathyrus sativus]